MYDNISQFLPNNTMTREEASKFFGVFAQKEYNKIEDSTKKCTFYDINKADPTLKNNIIIKSTARYDGFLEVSINKITIGIKIVISA